MWETENRECVRQSAAAPHILFVITDLQVGGTERQVALLAAELVRAGFAITVFSLTDGEMREYLERSGAKVIVATKMVSPRKSSRFKRACLLIVAAGRLLWHMLTQRPTIVHFFLPAAYLVGAPLSVLACLPIRVMSRRSLNNYQRNRFLKAMECRLHGMMAAIIGNSHSVIEQLRGLLNNGDERCVS